MTSDNLPLKELAHPGYSQEECEMVVQYLMALKSDLIREFLTNHKFDSSGTKPELRDRIETCLKDEKLKYEDIVNFIDTVAPCGKQHIILYEGSESLVKQWKKDEHINKTLKKNGLAKYLNARLPLILPEVLTISSITYKPGQELKISAVERREYTERVEEYDKEDKTTDGGEIELRAYLLQVSRGVIIFTWDLVANTATIQISQLPGSSGYEEKEGKFAGLINSFLDIMQFEKIDLRRAITKLNELEEAGKPEARSHGIGYKSPGGRMFTVQSPTCHDSTLGESGLDRPLCDIRAKTIGHIGNFYWLEASACPVDHNPLQEDVHTIIIGDKSRINFTTPNKAEEINYVLSRVRELCQ